MFIHFLKLSTAVINHQQLWDWVCLLTTWVGRWQLSYLKFPIKNTIPLCIFVLSHFKLSSGNQKCLSLLNLFLMHCKLNTVHDNLNIMHCNLNIMSATWKLCVASSIPRLNIYGTFIIRGSFFVSSQILPHDEGAFLYPRKIQPHSEGAFLYLSMNDCINKNSQALKCYDLSQTHCSQSEPEWVTSMFLKSQPVVTRGSAAT